MATTIINSSTHSASSCYSQKGTAGNSDDGSNKKRRQPRRVILGNLVSITVRKDNPKAKAGIKLIQDRNGQVTVKNIASNGLFGNTELEVGDIILSVNRKRLSDGEGPDLLMKWVHKYNTISISVRKPPPPPLSLLPSPAITPKTSTIIDVNK